MQTFLKIIFSICVIAFIPACSLESASKPGGGLKIILEEKPEPQLLFDNFILANPASTSEFQCFAINVTGPGVSADSQKLQNCTSQSNFNGHGVGIITEPKFRGQTFEIDVPGGPSRAIDVYGIFPTPSDCIGNPNPSGGGTGSGGGYLLGSVLKNLVASMTVTIPISYGGGNVDVSCAGNGGGFNSTGSPFPYRGASSLSGYNLNLPGQGFLSTASVSLGGTPCPIVSITSTKIICSMPSLGAGTYQVVVDNGNGQSFNYGYPYTVVAPGTAELSYDFNTTNVDFGAVAVGSSRTLRLSVANYGTIGSAAPSPTYPTADFSPVSFPGGAECTNGSLASNSTCYVDITFTPSTTGNRGGGATLYGGGMTFTATGL